MPDLNTDVSLFNLNNRGPNASLQTARNTLNQLLTDMNWEGGGSSASMLSTTSTTIGSQQVNEALVGSTYTANNNSEEQLFYTANNTNGIASTLWVTDGRPGSTIELSSYFGNLDRNRQTFDLIDAKLGHVYFLRELVDGSPASLAQPHRLELWKNNGTLAGMQLVRSWNDLNPTSNPRSAAIALALGDVGAVDQRSAQPDHSLAQQFNQQTAEYIISNIYEYRIRSSGQLISSGLLTVSGKDVPDAMGLGLPIADFGPAELANLGATRLPVKRYGDPNNVIRFENRLYLVKNQSEIWTAPQYLGNTDFGNGALNVAQKLWTAGSNIQAVYDVADRLIVVTDRGIESIQLQARIDPISELISGNVQALKQLAWEIGGAALAQEVVIPEADKVNWGLVGIRDYDGDGDSDIFWRNRLTGQAIFWQMNGLKFEKGVIAGPQGDYRNWQVNTFADFDRDGDLDMFWQHTNGTTVIWEMQGLSFKSGSVLPNVPVLDWYFSGVGDFNGDRNLEFLWRNINGTLVTWEIQDFKLKSGKVLANNVGPAGYSGWTVQAVTDFDNDGDSDILWSKKGSPDLMVLWEMQAGQFNRGTLLPLPKAFGTIDERPDYNPADRRETDPLGYNRYYGGQLDLNGDGQLDIWWKSAATGRREGWKLKRTPQGITYEATLTREGIRFTAPA
jgi:hypothetical protein